MDKCMQRYREIHPNLFTFQSQPPIFQPENIICNPLIPALAKIVTILRGIFLKKAFVRIYLEQMCLNNFSKNIFKPVLFPKYPQTYQIITYSSKLNSIEQLKCKSSYIFYPHFSERADATGATGQRLKESGSINKSLVTLGNVISSLGKQKLQ